MQLWLPPTLADELRKQAAASRTEEVCGIIAGVGEKAHQIIPIPNAATDRAHRFQFDEQAYVEAIFTLQRSGLSLIGIYHSHPNSDPIPSETDIRQATYPDTAYLIIGLRAGEAMLAGWNIQNGEVNRIEVYVSTDAPPRETPPLTRAEKSAILIAALFGVIFMLLLSLTLLPPAPVIVTPLP